MMIRPIAIPDIPAALPLVEQYWIFEDIAGYDATRIGSAPEFTRMKCTNVSLQRGRGNDAARDFYRRQGYTERSGYELLDKMLPQ